MWFGHFHICKRTHQLVISLWMIYIFKILLWTPKEVTKMIVKNDNSNLPYLLPSWQNILFTYLYFFRFSFVFRRKKASDFSFFEKTELSRNFHALLVFFLAFYARSLERAFNHSNGLDIRKKCSALFVSGYSMKSVLFIDFVTHNAERGDMYI